MVLDFDYALPSTVAFFSQFKCRLGFIDIYREQFIVGADLNAAMGSW
mgnify:CR=1 FL=1